MKIELKIDGIQVRMNQKANIAVTHSIADIQEPDTTSAGYSKSVELPLIPYNMRVFRFTNELYSKEQFNNELHTAEYIVDGNIVMSGIAQIDKITYKFGAARKLVGGSFHMSIIGAAFEWITRAKRQMNELESDETVIYAMDTVYKNSTQPDVSLIKFFPVDRGAFWEEKDGEKVPRTYLELKDYHPFFNVWKMLGLILDGYTVKSSMKNLFEKLYCSGYIPEQEDLSYIKEENDFLCGTTLKGRDIPVHILPITLLLFNKWIPDDDDPDLFVATDGILQSKPIGETVFHPTVIAPTSFKIKMYFRSIISASNNFINGFSFGPSFNSSFRFGLIDSDEGKEEYWTHFPGFFGGNDALLIYFKLKNPTDFTGVYSSGTRPGPDSDPGIIEVTEYLGPIEEKGQYMLIYEPALDNPSLYLARKNNTSVAIDDDKEVEKFEAVKVTNRSIGFNVEVTTPSYIIPAEGLPLNIRFEAVKNGGYYIDPITQLSIGTCEIRPVFGNDIALNEPVGISTVGGTNSQLDYIAALRQMFNLMFYTNPLTKEVFIEPRTRFYNLERSEIVDWRGKIDYSQEIEIEELGGDIGKSLKLAYANGNEVVEYYNWKNRTELGAYSTPLLNKTADDTKEVVNGIFAPFLLRNVESVGMTIPQEKRENTQDVIDDVELEMTPIIGYFDDVVARTAGSDKGTYSHYPQLIFKDASKAINLGFDDIDWMPTEYGLNQYYQDNISAYNVGRRITMYLKLGPQDVEPIQFPNRGMQDFRAVFLLNIDGEDVPCLLESIEDYNPASGASTKCIFISDPNLKLTGDDLTVITYDGVAISRNNEMLLGYKKED